LGRVEGVTAGMGEFIGELMVGKIIDATMTMSWRRKRGKYSSLVFLKENWQIEGQIRRENGSAACA
jgi:hypothetical protein